MFEIKGKPSDANIPTTIRFTEKLFNELKNFSSENNVSFNYLVLQCCEYALSNKK